MLGIMFLWNCTPLRGEGMESVNRLEPRSDTTVPYEYQDGTVKSATITTVELNIYDSIYTE
jgi:hypothetical protein